MFVEIETFFKYFLKITLAIIICAFHIDAFAQVDAFTHFAEPDPEDDFRVIVGQDAYSTSAVAIDRAYKSGQVKLAPWSDSYWPVYKGLIASRYADPTQPNNKVWYNYYSHYLSRPSSTYVTSNQINQLSPSEKYDLLVGDSNWTLTKIMWAKGKASYDKYGVVATWTGICHGWAAASQIGMPTPDNQITVYDVTGRYPITFYKFDIMALVSYYHAKASLEDRFTGRRCRKPNPPRDGDRILDGSCFDTNPMTWHLAVTNRVGRHKKSFVMDTSSNTEVWNYVVDSYETAYYNPITNEKFSNINNAIVPKNAYTFDPYKKYRAENTAYIVGIIMNVYHPAAITPHTGSPAKQLLEQKQFIYELELDSAKNIIGGEWVSKTSPDFIWLLTRNQNPFLNPAYIEYMENLNQPVVDNGLARSAINLSHRGHVNKEIIYRILHKSLIKQ